MLFRVIRSFVKQISLEGFRREFMSKEEPMFIYFSFDINKYGFIHDINSKKVRSNGTSFGLCEYIKFENRNVPVITTDWMFELLSENAQKFIYCHELGHFKHLDKHVQMFKNGKRSISTEVEADLNAVAELGLEATINGINDMIEFIDSVSFQSRKRNPLIKELEERKAKLIELCK